MLLHVYEQFIRYVGDLRKQGGLCMCSSTNWDLPLNTVSIVA